MGQYQPQSTSASPAIPILQFWPANFQRSLLRECFVCNRMLISNKIPKPVYLPFLLTCNVSLVPDCLDACIAHPVNADASMPRSV